MKKLYAILIASFAISNVANAEIIIKGNFEQGGLLFGKTTEVGTLRFNGKKIYTNKDGAFVIGLKRKQELKNYLTLEKKGKKGEIKEIDIKKRSWIVQKINGIDKKKVTPPKEVYDRIIKEAGMIKETRKAINYNPFFKNKCFITPVEGRVTGVFGSSRILNGIKKSPHSGVDIAANAGTPVKASADGVVSLVHEGMYYSGKTIMINHGLGLQSVYIHLNEINVKKGQKVKQGEIIGKVGSTGRSTGAHLHWGISWFDAKLDPQKITNKACFIE